MKLASPRMKLQIEATRTLAPTSLFQMKGGRSQLFLYGPIGTEYADGIGEQDVVTALKGVQGDLDIYVSSIGGSGLAGVAIYNILSRHPGKKTVYVDGGAQSAASIIMMAGDDRIMMPGSLVMVHGPWSGVSGNAATLRAEADALDKLSATVTDIYVSRTKQSVETVAGWLTGDDKIFTAEEAVAAGLATRISNATDAQMQGSQPRLSDVERRQLRALGSK